MKSSLDRIRLELAARIANTPDDADILGASEYDLGGIYVTNEEWLKSLMERIFKDQPNITFWIRDKADKQIVCMRISAGGFVFDNDLHTAMTLEKIKGGAFYFYTQAESTLDNIYATLENT